MSPFFLRALPRRRCFGATTSARVRALHPSRRSFIYNPCKTPTCVCAVRSVCSLSLPRLRSILGLAYSLSCLAACLPRLARETTGGGHWSGRHLPHRRVGCFRAARGGRLGACCRVIPREACGRARWRRVRGCRCRRRCIRGVHPLHPPSCRRLTPRGCFGNALPAGLC